MYCVQDTHCNTVHDRLETTKTSKMSTDMVSDIYCYISNLMPQSNYVISHNYVGQLGRVGFFLFVCFCWFHLWFLCGYIQLKSQLGQQIQRSPLSCLLVSAVHWVVLVHFQKTALSSSYRPDHLPYMAVAGNHPWNVS